jgi:hypothetical protein
MFGIGLQEVILLLPLVAIYLLASVTLVPYSPPRRVAQASHGCS